jgi:hypothetical protein
VKKKYGYMKVQSVENNDEHMKLMNRKNKKMMMIMIAISQNNKLYRERPYQMKEYYIFSIPCSTYMHILI